MFITLLILQQGCVSEPSKLSKNTEFSISIDKEEQILQATKNKSKLVAFYSARLKEKESTIYRKKLAMVYLDVSDPESAIYIILPLLNDRDSSLDTLIIASKAYLDLYDVDKAELLLTEAIGMAPSNGEVANLLGITYAEKRMFDKSKRMFLVARDNFYDGLIIKNNLAMLSALEGNYKNALEYLSSIPSDEWGDPKFRSNLMLIMAKNNEIGMISDTFGASLSEAQINKIYDALRYSSLSSGKGGVQ